MDSTLNRPTAIVADDHPITAAALAAAISSLVEVVAIVDRGDFVVHAVGRVRPSLLLLDLAMPGANGLDLIAEIVSVSSGTKVLVVSAFGSVFIAEEALAKGAVGFVAKAARENELVSGVSAVLAGETFVSWGDAHTPVEPAILAQLSSLSHRQGEILRLIGRDLRSDQIAASLGISIRTVHHHRTELRKRLVVESDWELRRVAHLARLLDRPVD